jgi:hypothetical protein
MPIKSHQYENTDGSFVKHYEQKVTSLLKLSSDIWGVSENGTNTPQISPNSSFEGKT